jgi:hypothetical protein
MPVPTILSGIDSRSLMETVPPAHPHLHRIEQRRTFSGDVIGTGDAACG